MLTAAWLMFVFGCVVLAGALTAMILGPATPPSNPMAWYLPIGFAAGVGFALAVSGVIELIRRDDN